MGESEADSRCIKKRLACRLGRSRVENPLFLAVLEGNFDNFKSLVESGRCVNTWNQRGRTLLQCIIEHRRFECFAYVLGLEDIDVDYADRLGRTPLLFTISEHFNEYFALQLIANGANVKLTDNQGFTLLHIGARATDYDNIQVGRTIIEKGADVNARALYGVTPLYTACEEQNIDWIYMLLYYGANAAIPSDKGVQPIGVLSSNQPDVQEILFKATFDETCVVVRLPTLVAAMAQSSNLFEKIITSVSDVQYDLPDLEYFFSFLVHVKIGHFKLFVEKYGYIVKEMIEHYSPFPMLIRLGMDLDLPDLKGILYIFFESNFVSEFVQNCDSSYPIISGLTQLLNRPTIRANEEEVTSVVCLTLSHGLSVFSTDLDTVYSYYGHCELFRILLHMDIKIVDGSVSKTSVISPLYYNFNIDLTVLFDNPSTYLSLLRFYNHPKLKELIADNPDNKNCVHNLPPVPCLLELSRNIARDFIVKRYNIENSVQFYTILKSLPIGESNKKIIALETPLY